MDTRAIEELVRAGRLREAERRLREAPMRGIARADARALANLARRAGLWTLSLRILNPIVRPADGRRARLGDATDEEKIEYASSLRAAGALDEAEGILAAVDAETHPAALFQRALGEIARWRYDRAIPLLRAFIAAPCVDDYARLAARINLLAALINEGGRAEARRLHAELSRALDRERHRLLWQHGWELGARLEVAEGDWEAVLARVAEARRACAGGGDPVADLWMRKWESVALSRRAGRVAPELEAARAEAARLAQWETVRDCDYYAAGIGGDGERRARVFFGTPFASFRARIPGALPESWLWREGAGPGAVLDLRSAEVEGGVALGAGQSLHRLLVILCADLYRPAPLVSVFAGLFPGEHYYPESSPARVHQVLQRLRRWIRAEAVPLELGERDGAYRLRPGAGFAIRLPRDPLPLDGRALELARLRARVGAGEFTAREARERTGDSKSALNLLLRWAVETGRVAAAGRGRGCYYRWVI